MEFTVEKTLCRECQGYGYVEQCINGHQGHCPCRAYSIECEVCGGSGRICPDCGEAMALEEPVAAVRCGDCERAWVEERAEQEVANV